MMQLISVLASVFASLLAIAAVPALAQSAAKWPERPVRLLVTVGAGGVADTLSRNMANGFQQLTGQPLIVENRAGAGGTIAAAAVAREKPDGYTLFLAEVGPNAVAHVLGKIPYDPSTAFTPVIHAANFPAVILIRPALPYATLGEFIAAAKQQPGKFNYSSAGIDLVHVTYRSGAEMLTALLRNDADIAMISVSTSLGQIKEGKVRALAGAAARPMQQLPDTPSAAQTIPGFDLSVWHGIVGPAGMDPELVTRMNGIFNQTLQEPAVRAAITGPQAGEIVGGTPQQFDTFIKSELKRWPDVVKAAGITPQ